jgi:hypothetical protein
MVKEPEILVWIHNDLFELLNPQVLLFHGSRNDPLLNKFRVLSDNLIVAWLKFFLILLIKFFINEVAIEIVQKVVVPDTLSEWTEKRVVALDMQTIRKISNVLAFIYV